MNGLAKQPDSASILETVLEACRSFIFMCDAGGTIDYANPAALKLFGKAETVQERDSLFDMSTNRKGRQFLQRAAKNIGPGERRRLEIVLHTLDGLHVPSNLVVCAVEGEEEGRFLVIGDPTEAIAASAYVSSVASNNLVVRMLHGSIDPVFLIDPPTRLVRDCNPAAVALFGWSRNELIGTDLRKLYHSEEEFLAIGKRLPELESKSGIYEEKVQLKSHDGGTIACKLITLCIFGPKGDPELRVAILHDITESQLREEMLLHLAVRSTELAAELTQLTKNQIPIGKESLTSLGFTERQAQLARFATIGLTTKEMAFRLDISESTVKNHFAAMFRKFGISSRIELIGLLSGRRMLPK